MWSKKRKRKVFANFSEPVQEWHSSMFIVIKWFVVQPLSDMFTTGVKFRFINKSSVVHLGCNTLSQYLPEIPTCEWYKPFLVSK